VEGDLKLASGAAAGSQHILQAVSGSGANKQVYNYSTDRVVGNGSFGVVFQATCLETGETVSARSHLVGWHSCCQYPCKVQDSSEHCLLVVDDWLQRYHDGSERASM
jgi:hypothetical protein